jgi:hypothetical protein
MQSHTLGYKYRDVTPHFQLTWLDIIYRHHRGTRAEITRPQTQTTQTLKGEENDAFGMLSSLATSIPLAAR